MKQLLFIALNLAFGLGLASVPFSSNAAPPDSGTAHLQFVGSWEGTSTLYRPRDTTRDIRVETVRAVCDSILKGTYVRCQSRWTREDGRYRDLNIYWNYNALDSLYDILFLYDDWPGKVNYPLTYDAENREFTGVDTFTTPKGVAARERVSWTISADGNTIVGTEHNHFATDPPDYWPMSFKFIWHRVAAPGVGGE